VLAASAHLQGASVMAVSGSPLLAAVQQIAVGAGLGGIYALLYPIRTDGAAARLSGGMTYGLLWWLLGPLSVSPLLHGRLPGWSLPESAAAFPSLFAYVIYGAATAAAFTALGSLPVFRPREPAAAADQTPGVHIVILGGGFGGVSAAQHLEALMARDHRVKITLVSQSNYLLFTPMLAEVASSGLEAQHISAPVRAALTRTTFLRAEVEQIDPGARVVRIRTGPSTVETLRYDHLILSLGSVPNFYGLPGLEAHAFTLKSLDDASRLRNHVIGLLERADAEPDPAVRRGLLTFVVAGGGFAGAEMIAELFDLVHNVRRYYQHIGPEDPRFVLVHSGTRILPELSETLAAYAQQKLSGRGVELVLGARVAGARAGSVQLAGGVEIPTSTLVWTAGNQPHPMLHTLPCERNRAGAVIVEPTLQVRGVPHLWAVGDCAEVPDVLRDERACPPTAQHAIREGHVAAANVVATLRGRTPRPFRYRTFAVLVALGHRTAVAEIRGVRFSGFLAWLLWRSVYLAKLPGLEKKVRVALDWALDLLFPRDIALTTAPSLPATVGIAPAAPAPGAITGGEGQSARGEDRST
jgi:NADH dehydrogenase